MADTKTDCFSKENEMKHTKWILPLLALALVMGVVGCKDEANDDELQGSIKIAGSSTVFPVTSAMAEEFMKKHRNVKITVSSTGTGGGFKDHFIPGHTVINNASRPIKSSEREKAIAAGREPIELKVGIDALSVVVNPDADWVDSMTFDELKQVWGPENPPSKWSQVNGDWPDEDFELLGPASTSGTFDYFTETVIGKSGAHRSSYHKTERDNDIVQAIRDNKYAMGYFGFAYYISNKGDIKAVAIAKSASDEPVKPSLDNAQSGAYPLSRPLFIYVAKSELEKPHVKAFIEFYIRQAATSLVSEVGYVPITEAKMKENLKKVGIEP
jgi:phosphate transport system substrate-binding protein